MDPFLNAQIFFLKLSKPNTKIYVKKRKIMGIKREEERKIVKNKDDRFMIEKANS